MKTHIQNLFVVLAILAAIQKAAAQYARFSGNWIPHQVPANTHDGLTTNAGICTVTLGVSGVVANLTLVAGDGAGGVQRFASNADSYCTSIA